MKITPAEEEARLVEEYARRDARLPWNSRALNVYHPRHPVGHLLQQHTQSVLVDALNRLGLELAGLRILDLGCGYGTWLRFLVELGAAPENCVGVDLSRARIEVARQINPAVTFHHQNISELGFPNGSFDIVLQFVVFSSILDEGVRRASANEMRRVTKAGGLIFWLDLTRTDSDVLRTFSRHTVSQYFHETDLLFRRPLQPRYFRRINGRLAWLARSIYQFTSLDCDCELIILKNGVGASRRD